MVCFGRGAGFFGWIRLDWVGLSWIGFDLTGQGFAGEFQANHVFERQIELDAVKHFGQLLTILAAAKAFRR